MLPASSYTQQAHKVVRDESHQDLAVAVVQCGRCGKLYRHSGRINSPEQPQALCTDLLSFEAAGRVCLCQMARDQVS